MKHNCRMDPMDLQLAQLQRRLWVDSLPPLGADRNTYAVQWIAIGIVGSFLAVWWVMGGP